MMLSKVRGSFTGVTGSIVDAAEDPKYSSVKAEIDVTTLITGDPQRDEHLRSADFFDVDDHPKITFESRRVSGAPRALHSYRRSHDPWTDARGHARRHLQW